jgi:glycosyltransferase involved in cell wall biosynthesis
MEPFISVCMPSYNQEKFIGESIESVLKQTYSNFELIIIDNISEDNSPEIIKSYGEKDSRIRFYENDRHLSCYNNCNKAISLAKGEFIAFLHSDDLYNKHFLEEIVKAYNQNPDKKVFLSAIYKMDQLLNSLIPSFPFKSSGVKSQKEVLMGLAYENNIGNGISVVIHKECLNKVGIFDNEYNYCSDYDLFMRLANDYEFVYINKALTYYRMHEFNLTNFVFLEMVKQGHAVCNKNFKNGKIISKSLQKQLLTRQWNSMMLKAFYIGIKYKSKDLTKDLIDFYRELYPDFNYEKYKPLFCVHKFIINHLNSKFIAALLLKSGRFYRNYTVKNIERLKTSNV